LLILPFQRRVSRWALLKNQLACFLGIADGDKAPSRLLKTKEIPDSAVLLLVTVNL
jgi:hypothetical protein